MRERTDSATVNNTSPHSDDEFVVVCVPDISNMHDRVNRTSEVNKLKCEMADRTPSVIRNSSPNSANELAALGTSDVTSNHDEQPSVPCPELAICISRSPFFETPPNGDHHIQNDSKETLPETADHSIGSGNCGLGAYGERLNTSTHRLGLQLSTTQENNHPDTDDGEQPLECSVCGKQF